MMFRAESEDGYLISDDAVDSLVNLVNTEVAKGHGFGARVQVTVEVVPMGEGDEN